MSRSPGKLTWAYNIELKDHHRALCDARAAAQLDQARLRACVSRHNFVSPTQDI